MNWYEMKTEEIGLPAGVCWKEIAEHNAEHDPLLVGEKRHPFRLAPLGRAPDDCQQELPSLPQE